MRAISAEALSAQPLTREWRPSYPLDLRRSLGHLARGKGDPTQRLADGALWRTAPTPDGPGTLRLRRTTGKPAGTSDHAGPSASPPRCDTIVADAWGPGGPWLLEHLPSLLCADDDVSDFGGVLDAAPHPVLAEAWRTCGNGLRFPATRLLFDQVSVAVLEQKVTGIEARRSWRELVWRFGSPAPGPAPQGMAVAPYPADWLAIPDWEWHKAGVDLSRRRAIRAAATVAARLDQLVWGEVAEVVRILCTLPGIGPWTAAEAVQRAMSGADVVSVGDFHLPNVVGWALVGRKLDDAGMLEVLAPYAPHRARAVRLVEVGPAVRPPRRGPRFSPRDYRTF
ncbi:DNA-3-methyladenine glycosylase family protein [Cryptosporangium minutisporangium]|uniref:3-methyladenine DNA glycosylase n=1 Tax=Cryptosporangium minutisporangium TaxID=113569 RepID=A0ABP6SUB7_9ACTN